MGRPTPCFPGGKVSTEGHVLAPRNLGRSLFSTPLCAEFHAAARGTHSISRSTEPAFATRALPFSADHLACCALEDCSALWAPAAVTNRPPAPTNRAWPRRGAPCSCSMFWPGVSSVSPRCSVWASCTCGGWSGTPSALECVILGLVPRIHRAQDASAMISAGLQSNGLWELAERWMVGTSPTMTIQCECRTLKTGPSAAPATTGTECPDRAAR